MYLEQISNYKRIQLCSYSVLYNIYAKHICMLYCFWSVWVLYTLLHIAQGGFEIMEWFLERLTKILLVIVLGPCFNDVSETCCNDVCGTYSNVISGTCCSDITALRRIDVSFHVNNTSLLWPLRWNSWRKYHVIMTVACNLGSVFN